MFLRKGILSALTRIRKSSHEHGVPSKTYTRGHNQADRRSDLAPSHICIHSIVWKRLSCTTEVLNCMVSGIPFKESSIF